MIEKLRSLPRTYKVLGSVFGLFLFFWNAGRLILGISGDVSEAQAIRRSFNMTWEQVFTAIDPWGPLVFSLLYALATLWVLQHIGGKFLALEKEKQAAVQEAVRLAEARATSMSTAVFSIVSNLDNALRSTSRHVVLTGQIREIRAEIGRIEHSFGDAMSFFPRHPTHRDRDYQQWDSSFKAAMQRCSSSLIRFDPSGEGYRPDQLSSKDREIYRPSPLNYDGIADGDRDTFTDAHIHIKKILSRLQQVERRYAHEQDEAEKTLKLTGLG